MSRVRIAQYGTGHGHAAGKLLALRSSPLVELAGVYEPDPARRRACELAGGPFAGVHWFATEAELLGEPGIVAVASEGRNDESLDQTERLVRAGKHVWYDKPAGADMAQWRRVVALAEARGQHIQMGYMFRYHHGFRQIASWAHAGLLGRVYAVRAHMSTWLDEAERLVIARHRGGILYDLGGHMIDQIVHLLGRPEQVDAFVRHDDTPAPGFADNTLAVLSFAGALATVEIAAMEPPPIARRFEVYGSAGSAIMEPFEPNPRLRLCLREATDGFRAGEQFVPVAPQERQALYDGELAAFVATLLGARKPDRTAAHELLVQETLLRAVDRSGQLAP